jgi:hypothetical protein
MDRRFLTGAVVAVLAISASVGAALALENDQVTEPPADGPVTTPSGTIVYPPGESPVPESEISPVPGMTPEEAERHRVVEDQGLQVDTTQADAVMEALRAGEIREEQNPCTYPADLRAVIELSDEDCAGELGRVLEEQYE